MQAELDDFVQSLLKDQSEPSVGDDGSESAPSPQSSSFFAVLDQFLVPSGMEEDGNRLAVFDTPEDFDCKI